MREDQHLSQLVTQYILHIYSLLYTFYCPALRNNSLIVESPHSEISS